MTAEVAALHTFTARRCEDGGDRLLLSACLLAGSRRNSSLAGSGESSLAGGKFRSFGKKISLLWPRRGMF